MCRNQNQKCLKLIKFFVSFRVVAECCAYVEECNSETAYNEAIKDFPTTTYLAPRTSSEAHSLAYVLKGINEGIKVLMIAGDDVFPLYTAILHMSGSVSFVTLYNSFYNLNVIVIACHCMIQYLQNLFYKPDFAL